MTDKLMDPFITLKPPASNRHLQNSKKTDFEPKYVRTIRGSWGTTQYISSRNLSFPQLYTAKLLLLSVSSHISKHWHWEVKQQEWPWNCPRRYLSQFASRSEYVGFYCSIILLLLSTQRITHCCSFNNTLPSSQQHCTGTSHTMLQQFWSLLTCSGIHLPNTVLNPRYSQMIVSTNSLHTAAFICLLLFLPFPLLCPSGLVVLPLLIQPVIHMHIQKFPNLLLGPMVVTT